MRRLFAAMLILTLGMSGLMGCTAQQNRIVTPEPVSAGTSEPISPPAQGSGADSAMIAEGAVPAAKERSRPSSPGFRLDFSELVPVLDAGVSATDKADNPNSDTRYGNSTEPFLLTDAAHVLLQEAGSLRITGNRAAQPKATFSLVFPTMDLSLQPTVSLAVRANRDTNLSLALEDADGKRGSVLGMPVHLIRGGKPFIVHTFGFEALDGIDMTRVTAIRFAINPDGPDYNGTLWMDDILVGGAAMPAPEMTGVPDWSVLVGASPFTVPLQDIRTYAGKHDGSLLVTARSGNHGVLPDPEVTPDGLRLSPLPGKTGTALVRVRVTEPGVPGVKEERFRLQVVRNEAPSLSVVRQVDMETGKILTIPLQAIDDGNPETRQGIRLTAWTDNPALLSSLAIRHSGDDRWGELLVTATAGVTGEAEVILTLADDGGTVAGGRDRSEKTVRVRVFDHLNQPPRMDPIHGIAWTEGEPVQTILLTGLDDGDADMRQNLSLQVTSNHPDMLGEPVISPIRSGRATIRFRPAPGETGKADVTVVLSDDGGMAGNNGNAETVMRIPVEVRARPVTGFRDDFQDGVTDPVWLNSGEGAHQCAEADGALRIDVDKFATNNQWAGLWFSLPSEMDLSRNPRIRLRMKTDKPAEVLIFLWDARDVYNTAKTVRHVVGEEYDTYEFDFTGLLKSDKGEEVDLTRVKALLINFAPGMLYKGTWWFEEIAVGDQVPAAEKRTPAALEEREAQQEAARLAVLRTQALPLTGLSAAGSVPARINVDTTRTYQEMDGFGAFLGSGVVEGAMQALLLPKVVDIGMSMARFGVIDTEFEPVNDNPDPFVTDWHAFNPDALPLDWMRTLRASSGIDKFVVTMWSPPSWMKANRTLNSFYEAFNNKLEPRHYEEYAEHLVALVKTVKEHTGIDLYAVSLQNEPQFNEPYASCVINPEEYRDLLRVVGPRFRAEGLTTRFFLPEALPQQKAIDTYIRTIAADPVASQYMDLMAIHNYDADGIRVGGPGADEWASMYEWAQELRPTKTWMTETSGHADDWSGAETLAGNLYNALRYGNASAWIFWSFSVSPDSARYGLLTNGAETSRYAVSKQFYRGIRPGMVRVEAESDQAHLLVLAFAGAEEEAGDVSVSGSRAFSIRTLLLVNRSDKPYVASLQGASYGDAMPGRWTAMVTTNERFAVDGGSIRGDRVVVPARSVVTLTAAD